MFRSYLTITAHARPMGPWAMAHAWGRGPMGPWARGPWPMGHGAFSVLLASDLV